MHHFINLWVLLHERLLREAAHVHVWAMLDCSPTLALLLGLVS